VHQRQRQCCSGDGLRTVAQTDGRRVAVVDEVDSILVERAKDLSFFLTFQHRLNHVHTVTVRVLHFDFEKEGLQEHCLSANDLLTYYINVGDGSCRRFHFFAGRPRIHVRYVALCKRFGVALALLRFTCQIQAAHAHDEAIIPFKRLKHIETM
jgi:hypothetical protein